MSHTRNRIKCRKCGAVIDSRSRHDFVTCKCGAVAVDGGRDYRKWCKELDDIITVDDDGNETTKGEQ